jgi:hypothetical protein
MTIYGRLFNPLDEYASYSTHFVMLACRSSEQARIFSQDSNRRSSLQAINDVKSLGDPVIFGSTSSDIFLVMDTRRFSQFTIQKLEFNTLVHGVGAGYSVNNTIQQISMTVLDSVGISFFNYIQWLLDSQMQTNFDGMIFLLRVIFVGHRGDPKDPLYSSADNVEVQTITIPMTLFKMELNLDYAKGIYECEFLPVMNFSPVEGARWLNIGNASAFFSGTNNSKLGAMVRAFENELNRQSIKFYNELQPLILQAGRNVQPATGKFGRQVQYMITLPKEWEDWDYAGPAMHGALEKKFGPSQQQEDTTSNPAQGSYMSVRGGQTITQVLDLLLDGVPRIKELANDDRVKNGQEIVFYHYLVSTTSNDDSITVHVDIIPFQMPRPDLPSKKGAVNDSASETQSKWLTKKTDDMGITRLVPKNGCEFDYIFTGKNLDVLNFDMKIQNLQFLLTANTRVSEGEMFLLSSNLQVSGTGSQPKQEPPKPALMSLRAYDPVLLPLRTPAEMKAFSNYLTWRSDAKTKKIQADAQNYSRNLSAFYNQSPIQVNMVIKGNPWLLDKFNIGTPPRHVSPTTNQGAGTTPAGSSEEVRSSYREHLENDVLKARSGATRDSNGVFRANDSLGEDSFIETPFFVTVNIMGPNFDALSGEKMQGEFATRILNDNWYTVFQIKHTIDNGVFTQELTLNSYSIYGGGSLTTEQPTERQKQRA